MVRRNLYKRERSAPRKTGVLYDKAPIGLPDANSGEVSKAIYALAREAGVIVGQGSGYDGLRDEYTVIGKSRETGKAQDFTIQGIEVANVIVIARMLNGGRMQRSGAPR